MVDWLNFFTESIAAIHEPPAVVLGASGCREGWLQAEIFPAGRRYDVRVNEFGLGNRKAADRPCDAEPKMLAAMKIVGADYSAKTQCAIEAGANRSAPGEHCENRALYNRGRPAVGCQDRPWHVPELLFFILPDCVERQFPRFRLRIRRS